MITFATLYSGSSGNSTVVYDGNSAILIDIGKNAKRTTEALCALDIPPQSIEAVFITHEHVDHIAGLRVFCSRYHLPVYSSGGTLEALEAKGHLDGDFQVFQMTDFADVGPYHVDCFHTSHDAAESMGFCIYTENGKKLSVATDLGVMTDEVKTHILGSQALVLESNHDINMLFNGPYPYPLKRRIAGERGHLSNDAAAEAAQALVESGTEKIILGHISKNNNIPELAYQTASNGLLEIGAKENRDYILRTAASESVAKVEV